MSLSDDDTIIQSSPPFSNDETIIQKQMSQNVSSSPQVGLNPLVETATKLLSLGAQIQHLPHHGDVEKLREKIAQEIESFDYEIRKFWQDRTSINYPSYVLCTFIDEMVLGTHWGFNSDWPKHTLQVQYHQKVSGGQDFFDEVLHDAKQNPGRSSNIELLELLYICLTLGFKGKYNYHPHELNEIRQDIFEQIRRQKGEPQSALSPQLQRITQGDSVKAGFPTWGMLPITLCLLLVTYMGFSKNIGDISYEMKGYLNSVKPIPEILGYVPQLPSCLFKSNELILVTQFAMNQSKLSKNDKKLLDEFIVTVQANPEFRIGVDVIGRASKIGSKAHNKSLSKKRADSVGAYLLDKKRSNLSIISVEGIGTDNPLGSPADKNYHQRNQSVQIKVSHQKLPGNKICQD